MYIKRTRNPFKRRVNIERKVLTIVNDSLTECQPLVGLTDEAVAAWAVDLNRKYGSRQVDYIVETIMEISKRFRLNTDRSRDVFLNDSLKSPVSLANLVGLLATFTTKIYQKPIRPTLED